MPTADLTTRPSAEQVRRQVAQGDVLYKQVFDTPDGKKVLADLVARFEDRTSIVPGDPYATHAKEGAREVILFIKHRMKGASNARMDE
jgi:hypothetical protein